MIKLLVSMAGADFSYSAGATVSLDKDWEKRLIDSGQAVEVKRATKTNSGSTKPSSKSS
jgi:hypothetical protein